MSTTRHDVIVVGAGLAGLTAAQCCRRAGLDVLVFDPHPGGRARTDERDGFLLNRGPHALYRGGAGERLLRELGVRYTGKSPMLDSGSVLSDGARYPLPLAPKSMLTSRVLGVGDKAALAVWFARLPHVRAAEYARVPVAEWLSGLPERAQRLVGMAIRTSTYCATFDQMSAEAAILALRGTGVLYLDGGWQSLVNQLAVGLEIRAEAVNTVSTGTVMTDSGEYGAASVILAAGLPTTAARLLGRRPFEVGPPIESSSLDLGLIAAPQTPLLMGLDAPLYFSQHTPSAALAPTGRHLVHVARYLTAADTASPDAQRHELERHAGAAGVDISTAVLSRYLHRMTVVGAMATAAGGGLAGRPRVTDAGCAGVYLAGDWVGASGQLADASFASAEAAARAVCAKLAA